MNVSGLKIQFLLPKRTFHRDIYGNTVDEYVTASLKISLFDRKWRHIKIYVTSGGKMRFFKPDIKVE